MKRAELVIGKGYYYSTKANWNDAYISADTTLTQFAIEKRRNKVIIKETQLKTQYERDYRTREVLVTYASGREEWVPLSHIRGEYIECVKQIYKRHHTSEGIKRAGRYAQHLSRKREREVYKPAVKELDSLIRQLTGNSRFNSYVDDFGYMNTYKNWNYETVSAVINALKQSPALQLKTEDKVSA